MARQSLFGLPLRAPPPSVVSTLIVEPTLGLDVANAPMNLKPGAAPSSDNFIMREGALEPRPTLGSVISTMPFSGLSSPILGGFETVDVTGNRFPLVSTTTRISHFAPSHGWQAPTYVTAYGVTDPPNGSSVSFWDITQIYDPISNNNMAVLANGSYQSLYAWSVDAGTYSTLTGAPPALYVESFDNYLLAFNVKDSSTGDRLVQRVQWSDRGSASSWTGGLSGFQDLLDMRGQGTRVIGQDNRLLLFSEYEIWQGSEANFPFVFNFTPLDRNIGTPYSWTICKTPIGLMFLGRDLNIWWLPKSGGPAKQAGDAIWRFLRLNIDVPERAWATYDSNTNQYQLYYAVQNGTGYPQRALYLNLTGALGALTTGTFYGALSTEPNWAPQSFDLAGGQLSLTRGFEANLPASGGTTWSQLSAANISWNQLGLTWNQLGGVITPWQRATFVGSSSGSMYYLNSNGTSDAGVPVVSYWQSHGLGGDTPHRQKTLTSVRIDYQTASASSLTVQATDDLGETYQTGIGVNLAPASFASHVRADVYSASRYPAFKVSSVGARYRLWRFWATIRTQGR